MKQLQAVAENEVTTKMTEQTQLQQVMMKDLKKVKVGKKLAEYNFRKREELAKTQKIEREPKLTSSQYYDAGALGHSLLLPLPIQIQERKSHQGDSHSSFQERRHDFSLDPYVRNGIIFWITKWTRRVSLMTFLSSSCKHLSHWLLNAG